VISLTEPATHPGTPGAERAATAPSGVAAGDVHADAVVADHGYQISGAVVHVRLGLGLALGGLAVNALLIVSLLQNRPAWVGLVLAVVALAVSGYAAFLGIFGVIRYGLFTEGCGAQVIAHELHLARIAHWAGGVAQVTLLLAIVLTVILVVTTVA